MGGWGEREKEVDGESLREMGEGEQEEREGKGKENASIYHFMEYSMPMYDQLLMSVYGRT